MELDVEGDMRQDWVLTLTLWMIVRFADKAKLLVAFLQKLHLSEKTMSMNVTYFQ